jgi:protein TonB
MRANSRRLIALSLSVVVHLSILVICYYVVFFRAGALLGYEPYKYGDVTLFIRKDVPDKVLGDKALVVEKGVVSEPKSNNVDTQIKLSDKDEKKAEVDDVAKDSSDGAEEKNRLDERAIYGAEEVGKSDSEPFLEMNGWIWDAKPVPKDDTSESGMIVFEIKIDDNGEVLGVRTLEKTISGLLENVYRESLEHLTFSKTSSDSKYASVYTGKVTFIIKEK